MADKQSQMANLAAQAVTSLLDNKSTPEVRRNAIVFLDSIKAGDINVLGLTAFELVKSFWSIEIRHHGFKMLQHVVRSRWNDLNAEAKMSFVTMVLNMMVEVANTHAVWDIKSQTASLVAEVVRREGNALWPKFLKELQQLCDQGPVHAELVSMVLRWLPEDITVHNEDLEGTRRRELLHCLRKSLPEILSLLYKVITTSFVAAQNAYEQHQVQLSECHADAVHAALNAATAYAEWAPIPDLGRFHTIEVCGQLLDYHRFRSSACEFFKLISQRCQPSDESCRDFNAHMGTVFEILMLVPPKLSYSETNKIIQVDMEFATSLCETMVILGCNNLYCISGCVEKLRVYLLEMYGFLTSFHFSLHIEALSFWVFLLRELSSSLKANEQSTDGGRSKASSASGLIDKEKALIVENIISELSKEMLNVAFERLLKKSLATGDNSTVNVIEKWSDDFASKCNVGQYRSRLVEFIRLIAARFPITAAMAISERLKWLFSLVLLQDITVIEDTQLALETTVSGIFDGRFQDGNNASTDEQKILYITGGILQDLLNLDWLDPLLAEIHGKLLTSLGPYLKLFQDKTWLTMQKLFDLLNRLPILHKDQDNGGVPMHRIRQQVCSCFVRIAKEADMNLEMMQAFYNLLDQGLKEGRILQSESIILGEALLVMSSASGIQRQEEVLTMLLQPLKEFWINEENRYLSNTAGLIGLLTSEINTSENDLLWNIFHTLNFFERALKRSGNGKASPAFPQGDRTVNYKSGNTHPIASHLPWMITPLLKLLHCVNTLQVQALPKVFRDALVVTPAEQAALLGEASQRLGCVGSVHASHSDPNKGSIDRKACHIQNWVKAVRDSGYCVLGLAMTMGDPFFKSIDSDLCYQALLGNIERMEFRHVRLLIHSVMIPLVKSCPVSFRQIWLWKMLSPLLWYCEKFLSLSWDYLQKEGRAKVPDRFCENTSLGLKIEVMEEKLLRDLTRECSILLATMASPVLNKSLAPLEQIGQCGKTDASHIGHVDKVSSEALIGFLIEHEALALSALSISKAAFTWPDSDSVLKVATFCESVIAYAISTEHLKLQAFIAKDMFQAIVEGFTLESNATAQSELIGLCREILVHLSVRHTAPRQVLLNLPSLTQETLVEFESSLSKATTAKQQRLLIRSLLVSGGGEHMKALLSAQKSPSVITNLSSSEVFSHKSDLKSEEYDTVGLAALSSLF